MRRHWRHTCKQENGRVGFMCSLCSKMLARRDKLRDHLKSTRHGLDKDAAKLMAASAVNVLMLDEGDDTKGWSNWSGPVDS